MKQTFYSSLLPEMAQRSKYATVARLGFSSTPLRNHLLDLFSRPIGNEGSFLGDPVFEATFGWETAGETMHDLAHKLLSGALVDSMDEPPKELREDYRFPRSAFPYRHQVKAWEILSSPSPQSLIITSGTGSGKTECFMVPILDRLLRESAANKAPLVGVRALLLYPLNALINSQRDRLHAWTNAFDGDVRFCLYNGNTEETLRGQAKAVISNEVQDRKTLRENPPPILVTNATMLEYMLVRTLDAPILEKSRGKLEWIVLDEAHSYIGSQAAELALLLRRVLYGFGVHADQVRFVATSATIGDPNGEAGEKLRTFLADLAGVARDKVHVVSGNRSVPLLPPGDRAYADVPLASLQGLASTDESDPGLFDALSANKTALKLRARFVNPSDGKPVAKLSEVAALLPNIMSQDGDAIQDALNWIDLLTVATRKVSPTRVEPFLPLRAHLFHQVLAGIWACADHACTHKKGTKLDDGKWPYGTVYLEKRARCECGAPAFEVQSCSECNETFLGAVIVSKANECFLAAGKEDEVDEFSLEVEGSHEETEDDHEQEAHVERVLIANGLEEGVDALRIDLATLMVEPPVGTPTLSLLVKKP